MTAQEFGSYLLIGFIIMLFARYLAKDNADWKTNTQYNGIVLAFVWLAWPVYLVLLICTCLGQVKK